jgi:hypothetical protein
METVLKKPKGSTTHVVSNPIQRRRDKRVKLKTGFSGRELPVFPDSGEAPIKGQI